MKHIINTLLFTLLINNLYAQSQSFEWAKVIGGYNPSIAIDNQGNTYITGYFSGTADFDPGIGVNSITSNGLEVSVCKLNAAGNLVWVKHFGGYNSSTGIFANGIAVDALGSIYITGFYDGGTVDFDPGSGVFNLSQSGEDIFVSKLDSSGNFVWAKRIGGNGGDKGLSITLDYNNNILVTGHFVNTVDFDPGIGSYYLTSSSTSIFILKLTTNGNFVWAKSIGNGPQVECYCVRCDNSGNILITGTFSGTVDFNPNAGVDNISPIDGKTFVCKLDDLGNYLWAISFGGNSAGFGVISDASGNVYVTGDFAGTSDFDPNDSLSFNIQSVGGGNDAFICKFSSFGSLIWAKVIGGGGTDVGNSIVLDASGKVYTSGYFQQAPDFDPGIGVYNIQAGGGGGIVNTFVSCLDNAGNFVWAKTMGGNSNAYESSFAIDSLGNIYTAGNINGIGDFDPGVDVYNLVSYNPGAGSNSFIQKISYPKTLNLKLFIQGYYTGSNHMVSTLLNQGVGSNSTITDSITVELRKSIPPYEVNASDKATLNTDGTAICTLHANQGAYYIVVKHRNGIQTWSASPILFSSTPLTYDFTITSSKAYGNNMKQVQPNVWAFYSGDINHDENIDLLDLSNLETDINNFQFGYFNTDLNGDGNVDLLDIPILENNINSFIFSNHP